MNKICVVIAYALPTSRVNRFFVFNGQELHKRGYSVHIGCHKDFQYPDIYYRDIVRMPYPKAMKRFAKSRISNWIIRNIKEENSLVLFSDIDLWLPPQTLDFIEKNVCDGTVAFPKPYFVKPWILDPSKDRSQLHKRSVACKVAKPSCAMMLSDWYKVNGFDERMVMWGHQDRDLYRRYLKQKMGEVLFSIHSTSPKFSWVAHMPHDECQRDPKLKHIKMPEYNKKFERRNGQFVDTWSNPDWGLTIYE